MPIRALVVAAMMVGGATSPAQQFDLVCKGKWRFSASDAYEPHDFRLRLDLDAKRYCESECKVTRPIAEVQPNMIVFQNVSEEEKARGKYLNNSVDRTNGKFRYFQAYTNSFRDFIDEEADCERAPFSGFPQLETKF